MSRSDSISDDQVSGFSCGNSSTSRIDGRIGEQHHQPVDADAEPAGRRHAVFERADVVGVVEHRFLVARVLALDLRAEARRLVLGVVELGEAVRELAPRDEELEAIREERIRVVARASGDTSAGYA